MNILYRVIPSKASADQTPADRDRVIDGARAISLIIVVIGHAFMGVVAWPGGVPKVGNLLAAYPWSQAVTWFFQAIPLFFFAGGAANAISWERHRVRGGNYAEWMWARVERLLKPVWVYLIFAGTVAALVSALTETRVAAPLMFLTTQLLWFLGAYLLVTALTPLSAFATPRRGALAVAALLLGVLAIDLLRLEAGWPKVLGVANFLLVWWIPALLGGFRTRGWLARLDRRLILAAIAFNLVACGVLIHSGPWPLSLVGMPGEPVSNMAPPTVIMALHCLTWAALLTFFDAPLTRLLTTPRLWRPVTGVNIVAMTLYLWHLPVLVALFALTHAFRLERPVRMGADGYPAPRGWGYFWGSLPFWAIFALCVWLVVHALWPLEHARLPWWDSPLKLDRPRGALATTAVGLGVCGAGASLLALSATGLGGFPTRVVHYSGLWLNSAVAMGTLLLSGAVIRWAGGERQGETRKNLGAPNTQFAPNRERKSIKPPF